MTDDPTGTTTAASGTPEPVVTDRAEREPDAERPHEAEQLAAEKREDLAPGRGGRGLAVVTILLGVVLLGAVAVAVWLFLQLEQANDRIERQSDLIDEQHDLIEKKEAFGAAVASIQESIEPLQGLPFASMVPWDRYQQIAESGYSSRWDAEAMDAAILVAQRAAQEMQALQSSAALEAATNASGTAWEATLDQLGRGYVATRIDDAAVTCDLATALGCVFEAEPLVVHLNAASQSDPSMTDWIRQGVAYHEFAHVLQFTNPEATRPVLEAFDGNAETMADCYALAFLDGWTLEHEVWTSAYEGWDVNVGYGYVCNEAERRLIRDWAGGLGVAMRTLSPGGS